MVPSWKTAVKVSVGFALLHNFTRPFLYEKKIQNVAETSTSICNHSFLCFTEKMNIITGDGSYKRVYLVNDKLPGTPIIVYEGQEVCCPHTSQLSFF